MATAKGQETIYRMVSERLISALEDAINNGKALPWAKPWRNGKMAGGAISYSKREPYALHNQFMLGGSGVWVSWTEIQRQGAKLKENARYGFVVENWQNKKTVEVEDENGNVDEKTRTWWNLRYFKVYNVDDVEGLKPLNLDAIEANHADPIAEGEAIVAGYEGRETLKIYRDAASNDAYYSPLRDEIHVPSIKQYKKSKRAEYYSTLFHEMTHSTGHSTRLNRLKSAANTAFGSEAYSEEELVAEMGAAMLCATAGISTDNSEKNSVAYLRSWISALKDDVKMAYWASKCAEKAVSYILYGAEGYKSEDETEKAAEDKSAAESEDNSKTAEVKTTAEDSVAQPKAKGKSKGKKKTTTKTKTAKTKAEGKKSSPKVEVEKVKVGANKKVEYTIRCTKGNMTKVGTVFMLGGYRWAASKNEGGSWTITELTTGLAGAMGFKTKKDAIEYLERWVGRNSQPIEDAIKRFGEDLNPTIQPTTQILSLTTK